LAKKKVFTFLVLNDFQVGLCLQLHFSLRPPFWIKLPAFQNTLCVFKMLTMFENNASASYISLKWEAQLNNQIVT